MKWLFGVLLLASLIFFAFIQFGATGSSDSKGLMPQQALNAEKIKLLHGVPAIPASAVQTEERTASACMEWGDFSGSDLARATSAVSALQLGSTLSQQQVEYTSGYWVYIPPLNNHAEVEKKISQLKSIGLEEYFVVQEAGTWRNAISLGVFKTEEAAHKYLDNIKAKGVKSAVAGERTGSSKLTVFVLKDPDTAVTAKMAAMQKEFPGSELRAVACAEKSADQTRQPLKNQPQK